MRGDTAVIEMARASGLALVNGDERPASRDDLRHGRADPGRARRRRRGARSSRSAGRRRSTAASGALEALDFDLRGAEVVVACDVSTTFVDAARVFGPQKGADAAAVEELERRLERLASATATARGVDVSRLPGSGAAGGLAGGLAAVGAGSFPAPPSSRTLPASAPRCRARRSSITGEGRFDATSLAGKVVGNVLHEARELGTPGAVVAGDADAGDSRTRFRA